MGIKHSEPIWECDLCKFEASESEAKLDKWIDVRVEGNFDEYFHKIICKYCLREIEKVIKKS